MNILPRSADKWFWLLSKLSLPFKEEKVSLIGNFLNSSMSIFPWPFFKISFFKIVQHFFNILTLYLRSLVFIYKIFEKSCYYFQVSLIHYFLIVLLLVESSSTWSGRNFLNTNISLAFFEQESYKLLRPAALQK